MILEIEQLKRLAEADGGYSPREVEDIIDTWNALKPVIKTLKPIVELWGLCEAVATKGSEPMNEQCTTLERFIAEHPIEGEAKQGWDEAEAEILRVEGVTEDD